MTSKQKPRFGIDIDGTVTTPDTLIPHINERYKTNIVLKDVIEYDFLSAFPHPVDRNEFAKWFKENEAYMYSVSTIAQDAQAILEKWQHVYELIYISARDVSVLEITQKWFENHKVPFHHIELIGSHDKLAVAKKQAVDVFFEDKHDNAVMLAEELNIPVLLFDTPYNRKSIPSNVVRINNWADANHWISKHF
ncbi:nucleotidase [Ureibacillus sinduriensis]|uniref:Nucleotidase n=1 Tax=Ureibacillus sinduriensis BLB-1 = JCM 15800 TaxID=1384057 RepID=A0A0A3HQ93_9BACL|nr:nucleotidase [Ureibacillus sinduriensis]KGR74574.1 nucleotidase [Ureibacillus sinduriensis BLB-1 = JCM 15800]